MPIYAYRCDACGHRQDVLQKMSDPTLSVCPACGAESFARQLSAPAFQLKGTGWYVTDFRDNGKKAGGEDGKSSAGDDNGKAAEPKVNGSSDGKSESQSNGASAGVDSATPAVAPAASAPKAGASAGTTGGPSAG